MIIILVTVIAVLIIILLVLCCYAVYAHKKFAKKFANGTWIDNDGNVLIIRADKKIRVTFGVNTDGDEYELNEKDYSYSVSNNLFTQKYNIIMKDRRIEIDPIAGMATVYYKKSKVGVFAKNNLFGLD